LQQLNRLLDIMARLRDPEQGCPWDLKQDFKSLVPYTIEEAYEVAEAIEEGDQEEIKNELGDLLFQIVFYAQLGKEENRFDFEDIAAAIDAAAENIGKPAAGTAFALNRHRRMISRASFLSNLPA